MLVSIFAYFSKYITKYLIISSIILSRIHVLLKQQSSFISSWKQSWLWLAKETVNALKALLVLLNANAIKSPVFFMPEKNTCLKHNYKMTTKNTSTFINSLSKLISNDGLMGKLSGFLRGLCTFHGKTPQHIQLVEIEGESCLKCFCFWKNRLLS